MEENLAKLKGELDAEVKKRNAEVNEKEREKI